MEFCLVLDKRVIEYLNHTLESPKLGFVLHLLACYEYLQSLNFGGNFRGLLYLEIPVRSYDPFLYM